MVLMLKMWSRISGLSQANLLVSCYHCYLGPPRLLKEDKDRASSLLVVGDDLLGRLTLL